jgi:hypothetical protein
MMVILYCCRCDRELREAHEIDDGVCDDCVQKSMRLRLVRFRTAPRRQAKQKRRRMRVA